MGFSLGGAISGLFGSDSQASFHMDPSKVNQGNYQYGGWAGGANEAASRYNQAGVWGQNRQGVQMDPSQMAQSRGQQMGALDLQRQAAEGSAPSAAAVQQQQGLNASILAQGSAAASARGPAAMGAAQYGAAANSAAQSQAAIGQAAQLRAQEMAQARDAYQSGASGMRGQDFQQSAQQAQLNAQQRQMNDQYQLGMTGYETGVQGAQLQAQGAGQHEQDQNDLGAQALNLKAQQGADQENSSNAQFGIGTIAGAAMSDAQAKEGIQPEGGGAMGYGMPGGVGVDRSQMGMGDAHGGAGGIGPYMGLMSMNSQELGYAPSQAPQAAPAAHGLQGQQGAVAPAAKPLLGEEGSDLSKLLAMAGAGGAKDPYSRGQSAGMAARSGMGSLFGGENKGDTTGLAGSMGGGTGAAASGTAALSDAHAKEAAFAEGVAVGASQQQPHAPKTFGWQSPEFYPTSQEHTQAQHVPPVARPSGGGHVTGWQSPEHYPTTQEHHQTPQHAAPAEMLDQLQPVSYNYKPGIGEDPNRRQYGIIAQDLARTPMGASVVERRRDGLLAVNVPKATTANMAAAANLNQRVRELEANASGLGISGLTRGR